MTTKDVRPTLTTERLILRPFQMSDGPDVQRMGGDIRVSEQLSQMPHPYPDGLAEEWIATQKAAYEEGKSLNFAITLGKTGELLGSIGLHPNEDLLRAEVGYWIGVPHWGKGYTTEALQEMLRFGFDDFALQRIFAVHLTSNPASGRVMDKVGMKLEGVIRLGVPQFGTLKDGIQRAIVKPDWERQQELFAG